MRWGPVGPKWTTDKYAVQELLPTFNEGFVVTEANGVFFVAFMWSIEQFKQMVNCMTAVLIGRKLMVIAGDFNGISWNAEAVS